MDRNVLRLAAALGAFLALGACGGGGGNPMVMLTDGGPRDGGRMGTDSGRTGTDAGRSMCPPMVFPAPTSQPCAASTAMCVMGAMTQAQFDACIMADPMAMACDQCIFQDVVNSCTAMAGCDDEYGNLLCCFDANCPMPTEACLMGPCGTQTSAVDMCLAAGQMSRSCGISARCFQTASGFAPDFARPQLLNRFPLDIDAMRLGSTRL